MIDKYTSIGQIISENPMVADMLMRYGVQCYGNTENQLSSLEDVAIRYGFNAEDMISSINGNNNSLY